MTRQPSLARRTFIKQLGLGATLGSLAAAGLRSVRAAESPLLSVDAPEAKAVKYVEDAKAAGAAAGGNSCATCGLYQGTYGSLRGPCQIFPGKEVKAAGWCTAWAPQM